MAEKRQITVYLTHDDHARLNEIYAYRLLAGVKYTKSALMAEALNMLYAKEYAMSKRVNTIETHEPEA